MQPVRYSINVSLDGCVDHAGAGFVPGPEVHQHAADWLARHDVGLFGRVTYQLMEAWRPEPDGGFAEWVEPWMEPFARTIGSLRKIVVSDSLAGTDPGRQGLGWNTEVVGGADLEATVRALKEQNGRGIALGGVAVATAVAELGLIDEVQLVVHPHVEGHGPYLFEGLTTPMRLREVDRADLGSGVIARVHEVLRPAG